MHLAMMEVLEVYLVEVNLAAVGAPLGSLTMAKVVLRSCHALMLCTSSESHPLVACPRYIRKAVQSLRMLSKNPLSL